MFGQWPERAAWLASGVTWVREEEHDLKSARVETGDQNWQTGEADKAGVRTRRGNFHGRLAWAVGHIEADWFKQAPFLL